MREIKSASGLLNHVTTIYRMIEREREQALKHSVNPRCREAKYGGIAYYIEDRLGIPCTEEDVREAAELWF